MIAVIENGPVLTLQQDEAAIVPTIEMTSLPDAEPVPTARLEVNQTVDIGGGCILVGAFTPLLARPAG
jgi:hypothetical protein